MYRQSADVAAGLYDKPRKRNIPMKENDTNIDLNEEDESEDLGEILKRFKAEQKYNKYRTSDDPNAPPFIERLPRGYNGKWLSSQEKIYTCLITMVIIFVLFISMYNVGQLQRIKEKYGLEELKSLPTEEVWWRNSHMYYLYVRSFKDSDGNGIGDINGIRNNLDYLEYIGVQTIILSPIFGSPMVDCGNDISNFVEIDSIYGTMKEYESLISEIHEKGMKIIQEMVPNHSSRRHPWFQSSHQSSSSNYSDYYIWHEGHVQKDGNRVPPSNWISRHGGSAWTWDSLRQSYFYHYYHSTMPDLNHRNPQVRKEFKKIFKYWLSKDIDGLRLNDVDVILETTDVTLDEPENDDDTVKRGTYESVNHAYTERQLEIHEFLAGWGELIDEFTSKQKRKIVLLIDVKAPLSDTMIYYNTGADAPICRHLLDMGLPVRDESEPMQLKGHHCGGRCIYESFNSWMTLMPDDKDALWTTANVEVGREVNKRFGRVYSQLLTMVTMLMPGAVVNYYGQELGQSEPNIEPDYVVDVYTKQAKTGSQGRDPGRAPLHWSNEKWAGFTNASRPWLPVEARFIDDNISSQKQKKGSHLRLYKRLSELRKQPSFSRGRQQSSILTKNVYSFLRFVRDSPPYFVVMNFGEDAKVHDYSLSAGVQFADLVAHARYAEGDTVYLDYEAEKPVKINLEKLKLNPGEGLVVKLTFDIDSDSNIY